jgi:hypothetical protein
MSHWDAIGFVASALVLTAFGMKTIIPLRIVAMCRNSVFITYGLGLDQRSRETVGEDMLRQAANDRAPIGGMVPKVAA